MNNKIITGFDGIISDLNRFRDDIEQLEKDNDKLNDDLRTLEKEKDDAYKSFNTETHILVEVDALNSIKDDLMEAKSSANYALEEASGAVSCAEDASGSADQAVDHARYGIDKIEELIEKANKGDNNE